MVVFLGPLAGLVAQKAAIGAAATATASAAGGSGLLASLGGLASSLFGGSSSGDSAVAQAQLAADIEGLSGDIKLQTSRLYSRLALGAARDAAADAVRDAQTIAQIELTGVEGQRFEAVILAALLALGVVVLAVRA